MAVVRLHLTLIEMAGDKKELTIDARQPVLLEELLDRLGVPKEQVGIVIRNGRWEVMDCMIHEDDVVELFPVLSGG
jgi:sulfur carrier protein ThiS